MKCEVCGGSFMGDHFDHKPGCFQDNRAVTAPVLPEPTDETVEEHMREWHAPWEPSQAAFYDRWYPLRFAHDSDHGSGPRWDGTPAYGHTHERSHDG